MDNVIYELYYKYIYSISYTISRDRYLAEDITQETFIKVFNTLKDKKNLKKWLNKVAKSTALDYIKYKNNIDTNEIKLVNDEVLYNSDLNNSIEETVLYEEFKGNLEKLITKLSPQYQKVLILRYKNLLNILEYMSFSQKWEPFIRLTRLYIVNKIFMKGGIELKKIKLSFFTILMILLFSSSAYAGILITCTPSLYSYQDGFFAEVVGSTKATASSFIKQSDIDRINSMSTLYRDESFVETYHAQSSDSKTVTSTVSDKESYAATWELVSEVQITLKDGTKESESDSRKIYVKNEAHSK